MREEWRSLERCQVEPNRQTDSAFDIEAEFDVVVAATDAAPVAGGRDDDDDDDGINMHAKTFLSEEGEEGDALRVAPFTGANSRSPITQPMAKPARAPLRGDKAPTRV